jgi:glycosyltransferase involved in cell wall biosynthesis
LRGRIDVLHAHQLFGPAAVGCLGRAMLAKPLVLNPHNPAELALIESRASGALRLATARLCGDAFVSICTPITSELLRAGIDERRVRFVPNGVDTNHFRPADPVERAALRRQLGLPGPPIAVYSGRLSRVKGVDVLLAAWSRIEGKAQLCIVGDGEEEHALRAQAASLRGIRFVGAVRDPAPWLRAADAAVVPSRSDGLSIALLEAMSCGLPVAATAVGGTPDVVEHGVNGLLVAPEDPDALAVAVRSALETPSLGSAARARVVERHSIDRVAEQVLALYRELCPGVPTAIAGAGARRDARAAKYAAL